MRSNRPIRLVWLLPLFVAPHLLLFCAPLSAEQEQTRHPVEIEADRVDMDAKSGVSIFAGNAKMVHGEMTMSGERIEVYVTEEQALDHIIVVGQPARFRNLPTGQAQEIRAQAGRMKYYASGPERASLFDDVKVWQGQDTISGDYIFVNLETRAIEAKGNDESRARAILFPEQRQER